MFALLLFETVVPVAAGASAAGAASEEDAVPGLLSDAAAIASAPFANEGRDQPPPPKFVHGRGVNCGRVREGKQLQAFVSCVPAPSAPATQRVEPPAGLY